MRGRDRTRGILTLDDVRLVYEGEQADVVAVDRIDLEVYEGERLLLLGPSGCGKSTILRAIGGFMTPQAGRMAMNGEPIRRPGPDRLFVFQEFDQLLPWKTVRGNIAFALTVTGRCRSADARSRADEAIGTVGLRGFEEAFPHQLSGGMKQRVAIARALALRPPVLLMDEPFAALDAQTREQMQQELLAVHAQMGTTLVFVTHSISEAITLADRIVVLSKGPASTVVDLIETDGRGGELHGSEEYSALSERIRERLHNELDELEVAP